MEEIEYLTNYISVWGWNICALMFLTTSFILFSLQSSLKTQSFTVACILAFIMCEFMMLKRKGELSNE